MRLKGQARTFKQKDDINTDYIISGRYKFKIQDPVELAKHVMEDIDPKFYERRNDGDFIVAGRNFGCGSSREQAPQAIKYAKIGAVIAKSFARIFYRNAFNIGVLLVECNTDGIDDADQLELDLDAGILKNITKSQEIKINPLPKSMQILLNDGGVIEHFKKHKGFKF
ncbi:3-isopropylmalate dehydratase small subunit [bacterium]|nr:3-isopropylmalate dehydratase small subunit [bacterium]